MKTQGGWKLQSVLTGENRNVAVIDGVAVAQGDWYQGARLVEVQSERAILRTRSGKKVILKLTPGIQKMVLKDMEKTK